ncbi:MAG TPA: DUF1194 domain-containing protein [Azospirillaceae bacterium]|nr:DUF1194 domain-containing protein [Azospirillaceae bacterium]
MAGWRFAVVALAGLLMGAAPAPAPTGNVDLELVLAVDASASITGGTLEFQLRGHADAFRDPQVAAAISSGPTRSIAVTMVSWSDPGSMKVLVPWTVVGSMEDCQAFATAIEGARREELAGSTGIGSALEEATGLFAANTIDAPRKTIDLVSNGFNNSGPDPTTARDRAVAEGITINALAILDEYPWLEEYYTESVIGGPSSFVKTAESRESFAEAILQKMIAEIAQRPGGTRFAQRPGAPSL